MKELAVKAWVFNPALRDQLVRINGRDEEGERVDFTGFVTNILGAEIEVYSVQSTAKYKTFRLYEFHEEGLKMEVWDEKPSLYSSDSYWLGQGESEANE